MGNVEITTASILLQSETASENMAPRPALKPRGSVFNPRTITAPLAAIVMAGLLYTYSVTSIRAAKRNAQLHREADGGQLDMRKESLRRHGVLDKVVGTSGVELFRDSRAEHKNVSKHLTEKKAKMQGEAQQEEAGVPRTEVEGGLEQYKGRGAALKKFKEEKFDPSKS